MENLFGMFDIDYLEENEIETIFLYFEIIILLLPESFELAHICKFVGFSPNLSVEILEMII